MRPSHTRGIRAAVRTIPAALFVIVMLGACASAPAGSVDTTPQPAAADSVTQSGIEAARADSARHPYTEADIEFMTSMIGHHAQAIVMSNLAPARTESPSIRTLALRIINSQQDEIATMQQWLRDRRQPVPDPTAPMVMAHGAGHEMHGAGHDAMMPGMLSPAQLQQLDEARGANFDRLFLSFMIQHHRGAVAMVERLFGSFGAGQDESVFRFATDVNVDQITEIARMEQMLVALISETPPQ